MAEIIKFPKPYKKSDSKPSTLELMIRSHIVGLADLRKELKKLSVSLDTVDSKVIKLTTKYRQIKK